MKDDIQLRIRTAPNADGPCCGQDVIVEDAITGRQIGGVYKIEINMSIDSVVSAVVHLYPSQLDVKAEAVWLIKQHIRENVMTLPPSDIGFICDECALAFGWTERPGPFATYHYGTCPICHEDGALASVNAWVRETRPNKG